ncbi:MAG: FAD-dependent oxidoreductase [Pseudomonas sp.]
MLSPLILAGAGHAHLVVLRNWLSQGYRPPAGTLLLSPTAQAWYSGMMPGLLAGRFTGADCAIELAPLCEACGVTLRLGEISELEASDNRLVLADGSELSYELLSLNTGAQPPRPAEDDGSIPLLPAKPFQPFYQQWLKWRSGSSPASLAVLGGGAAAFELALALHASLPATGIQLLCRDTLLAGHPPGLITRARRLLSQRGVGLSEYREVTRIHSGQLFAGMQPLGQYTALVLATGASAHGWQARSGLLCDAAGFIRINTCLQSLSHAQVLATGDCAILPDTPHSGVYAVRQGAVLAENLRALMTNQTPRPYKPQPHALALLATADGGALLSYRGISGGGRLLGRWKDHLDIGFMRRHRV